MRQRVPIGRRSRRRGAALVVVLLLTIAVAAIATSAIFMTSSGSLLTKYYDREREFRYTAEAALAMGKARLAKDTALVLPDSGYVTLLSNAQVNDASGTPIPRVRVNLYAGLTGNTTGQFGKFVSVVAEAFDASGTQYVRRLEMQAENFAKFALFTNRWTVGCYTTGEFIRGRAHSNQNWQSCGTPVYYDTVSAVGSVNGGTPVYQKGKVNGAPFIAIPSVARLSNLHGHAVNANFDINAVGSNLGNARTRLEFVAIDLDNDGDVTDPNEGFFRVFNATSANEARANFINPIADNQCGDWHDVDPGVGVNLKFFPITVHNQAWYIALSTANGWGDHGAINNARRDLIINKVGSRCYPAGDPHLVAMDRRGIAGYTAVDWDKGGDDTTFTPVTNSGSWVAYGGGTPGILTSIPTVRQAAEAPYLFPLHRTLNTGSKGVIHVHGPVLLSGVLRGRVTIYASWVGFVDDLVYTQDPSAVLCANLLGVIADNDALILDNGINSPQTPNGIYRWTDDNQDWFFHGVIMSRTGTVGVENWNAHPESMKFCNGKITGRGCILQAGGVIEDVISVTFNGTGSGFAENRSVDQCMLTDSPPYFPTTGRYLDNRYYEIDPARFDPANLFRTLQGGL